MPWQAPLIVFGMHRSGSSWLSRSLHHSGIYMGFKQEHNAEALHFLGLNQKLLAMEGANWWQPKRITTLPSPFPSAKDLYVEHFKLGIENPLLLLLHARHPWGFKDPRNTFTLLAWKSIFPRAKFLHIYRNGQAVANSLWHRNSKTGEVHTPWLNHAENAFALWETYMLEVEFLNQQLPHIFHLSYEELCKPHSPVVDSLSRFVGRKLLLSSAPKPSIHPILPELEEIANKSAVYKRWYP